jgi:hypothetical protein
MNKAQVLTLRKTVDTRGPLEAWRRAGAQIASAALAGYKNENGEIDDDPAVNAEHPENNCAK